MKRQINENCIAMKNNKQIELNKHKINKQKTFKTKLCIVLFNLS